MAIYWMVSSFFLYMPFYLFKEADFEGCSEYDFDCIAQVCRKYPNTIIDHVKLQNTLTYQFQFFCDRQLERFFYKLSPQIFAIVGLLFYGTIADIKGRIIAFKISWRVFAVGLIILSCTQTQFLITFGYIMASIHCFPSLVIQITLLFQQSTQEIRTRGCLLLLSCLFVGPLLMSFLADSIFDQLGIRLTLGIFCAIPAFLASFFIGQINQSPVFAYKNDKVAAFNILNLISRFNKKNPILVDLAKSKWIKRKQNKINLLNLLQIKTVRTKMLVGFCFIAVSWLNIKASQTALDRYIEAHLRGVFMNVSTSIADITLCILIFFIKRSIRIMGIITGLLLIAKMALLWVTQDQNTLSIEVIVISILIRYFNQMIYGIVLIWSVETFPTECRVKSCCFVLCGCAFGTIAAYSLRRQAQVITVLQLVLTVFIIILQNFVNLSSDGKLFDTMKGTFYDKNDKFYRY